MIALVDGDSISYILGWHHREHQNVEEMHLAIDTFLENIFLMTGADMYFGALAGNTKCFRYDRYRVKEYKGNRPTEVQEHMKFWKPVIMDYLTEKWKFTNAGFVRTTWGLVTIEADDTINTAALFLQKQNLEFIICSPDKDLKQIPGRHYDYKTSIFCDVTEPQSHYNFFRLMLEGDDADAIAGIPGFGPKKAQEKLKPLLEVNAERIAYEELVKSLYHRHFGTYYGDIIYKETHDTISLIWDQELDIQIQSVPVKAHPFDQVSED